MDIQGYKNILFAIDLSIESTIMLRKVALLSDMLQANLNLIHILEPSASNDKTADEQGAKELLSSICEPLKISEKQISVFTGDVQENILKVVKEKSIDLIVIGSHGRKGISPLLGSTATAVLSSLKCDVLTLSVLRYPKPSKASVNG